MREEIILNDIFISLLREAKGIHFAHDTQDESLLSSRDLHCIRIHLEGVGRD